MKSSRSDWERGKAHGVQGSPHFFAGDHDWFCPTLLIRQMNAMHRDGVSAEEPSAQHGFTVYAVIPVFNRLDRTLR